MEPGSDRKSAKTESAAESAGAGLSSERRLELRKRWSWWLVLAVLLLGGLALSFGLWVLLDQRQTQDEATRLSVLCDDLARTLEGELGRRNALLRAVSLFYANSALSSTLWQTRFLEQSICPLTSTLHYFDLRSILWAPLVRPADVDTFRTQHGVPCIFQVKTQNNANATIVCANGTQSAFLPVSGWCTNLAPPFNLTGMDLLANPTFARAVDVDLNNPTKLTMTEPMPMAPNTMVFEIQTAYSGQLLPSAEQRRQQMRGLIAAPVDLAFLLKSAWSPIYSSLFVRLWSQQGQLLAETNTGTLETAPIWNSKVQVQNMNTPFTVECTAIRSAVHAQASPLPWVVLLFFVVSTALASVLWYSFMITRRALDQVRQAKAEADKAYQARRVFVAFLCHELRTPLQSAISMTEFAQERLRTETRMEERRKLVESLGVDPALVENDEELLRQLPTMMEALQTIHLSAQTMLAVVNDLLEVDRLEQGGMRLESIALDLSSILHELKAVYEPLLRQKHVQLVMEIDRDVARQYMGDPTRLAQVLRNLLGNASKFTPASGTITVRCRVLSGDELTQSIRELPRPGEITAQENWVVVEFQVQDTGIGIPPDRLAHLFTPYEQANVSTARQYGGSGLGLSIVRQLLTLMNGNVRAQSQEGVGTCFTVTLPLHRQSPPAELHGLSLEPAPVAAPSTMPHSEAGVVPTLALPEERKQRVLICEDSVVNQKLLAQIVRLSGYDVDVADNGQQGMDKVLANLSTPEAFDLVLMDLHMPILNGDEATSQLRAHGVAIPIVAITAAEASERQRFKEAGATDFLPKPITRQALTEMLRKHLDRKAALLS